MAAQTQGLDSSCPRCGGDDAQQAASCHWLAGDMSPQEIHISRMMVALKLRARATRAQLRQLEVQMATTYFAPSSAADDVDEHTRRASDQLLQTEVAYQRRLLTELRNLFKTWQQRLEQATRDKHVALGHRRPSAG